MKITCATVVALEPPTRLLKYWAYGLREFEVVRWFGGWQIRGVDSWGRWQCVASW